MTEQKKIEMAQASSSILALTKSRVLAQSEKFVASQTYGDALSRENLEIQSAGTQKIDRHEPQCGLNEISDDDWHLKN